MSADRCTKRWFTDGGRTEVECGQLADAVCEECGMARCNDHGADEEFDEYNGRVLCGDCAPRG